MRNHEAIVARHYAVTDVRSRVLDALREAGLAPDRLRAIDLAPVDEFHVGGRSATELVIGKLGLPPGARVLDIGCGIGGVARYLRGACGCEVSAIDLTPEYVELARELTALTELAGGKIDFRLGSALDLPWPEATFDAAVTFHVAMNIADRPRLYAEAARVVKPGGQLAIYDVLKGNTEGMVYPVPWAASAETSFLVTAAALRRLLDAAGFETTYEEDRRQVALDHHRARIASLSRSSGRPILGLHLLQGETAGLKSSNMVAALEADQVTVGLVIARRRG